MAVAAERRVDVVVGAPLVLPVDRRGQIAPSEPVEVRMDDGRAVAASLHWITVLPGDPGSGSWLPAAARWRTTPALELEEPPRGASLVLVADLPLDAIGQGVWIGRERVALNWMPEPPTAWRARRPRVPGVDTERGWSAPEHLERLLEPERTDPLRRWRYKLLTGVLGTAESATAARFDDPVLEAIARQREERWRVGLAWLREADAALAERVEWRLTALVDFGTGIVAPAWPTDAVSLDLLLEDLLDPRVDPETRADRARLWLEDQAPATAWVIDDAGVPDAATGGSISLCAAANLTGHAALAWAAPRGAAGTFDLLPAGPFQARYMPVHAGTPGRQSPTVVHLGDWQAALPVASSPVPATPPGLRLAPFWPDWTMHAWLAGSASEIAGRPVAMAALVHRQGGASGRWSIYVECGAPGPAAESDAAEHIRLWLGPFRRPFAVLLIGSDGSVVDEVASSSASERRARGVRVVREADRWIVQADVPPECIEADGTLRLGIERIDALGRRCAWPRPMLPWQSEPGRAAVGTTSWGSLARPAGPPVAR